MRLFSPFFAIAFCLAGGLPTMAQGPVFPLAVPSTPVTPVSASSGTQDIPLLPAPKPSGEPNGSRPAQPPIFPIPGDGDGADKPIPPAESGPPSSDGENRTRVITATVQVFGEADGMGGEVTPARVFLLDGEYLLFAPRGNPSEVGVVNPTQTGGKGSYSESIFIPGGYESGFRVGATWLNRIKEADFTLRYTYYSWQSDVYRYAPFQGNYPIYYPNPAAMSTVAGAPAATSIAPYYGNGGITTTLLPWSYGNVATQVSARSNILFQFGDIEFGKRFHHGDWLMFRVFGGPRYAYLSQSIQAQYTGGWVQSADYGSRVMFNGGGVRAGASADATLLGNLGVRIWGGASLVAGAYDGRVSQSQNGSNVYTMSETSFGTVPILEGGIGLNFRKGHWELLIGYEFQSWFNVLQGYSSDGYYGYQPRLRKEYGNLGFDGFAGIGVQSKVSW